MTSQIIEHFIYNSSEKDFAISDAFSCCLAVLLFSYWSNDQNAVATRPITASQVDRFSKLIPNKRISWASTSFAFIMIEYFKNIQETNIIRIKIGIMQNNLSKIKSIEKSNILDKCL